MASSTKLKRKVALAIGINHYPNDSKLEFCINDANDIADKLKSINFHVTLGIDCNRDKFKRLVDEFVLGIQQQDLVLFYFAGHGNQFEDKNYLLPADYSYNHSIGEREYIQQNSINAQYILHEIQRRRPYASIIILDCCRTYVRTRTDNSHKGLAGIIGPPESLIVFSCGFGQGAIDNTRNNRNGIFTEHLLEYIAISTLDIETILLMVTEKIKTLGFSLPWRSSCLSKRIYLAEESSKANVTIKTQPSSSTNNKHADMLNKTIRFDKDLYKIIAYIPYGNRRFFALECERSISGYDGICPVCHGEHVTLSKTRGFYVAVDSVYETLEYEKLRKERLQVRKDIDQLPQIEQNLPPLDYPILGINKGIEGDSNSCYMDATIFCMFAYSNVFDTLLHMQLDKNSPIYKLQKLLRENIVHILRSNEGFVQRDALFYLRTLLSEATNDQSFKDMNNDPTEFLRALEGLFHYAPLRTIRPDQSQNENGSNITTNIMWEMFDANPQNLHSINIARIFRNSLSEIPAKLATIPPFLILVAPRHTRTQRSYRYIIPDRQITLDDNIVQLVCLRCKKTNHDPETSCVFYSCDQCFEKESPSLIIPTTDTTVACYCTACLHEKHKPYGKDAAYHNVKRISIDKHKLNLFAVLCIETSHYVAFVKCQNQNQQREWLFFDSMSDRIHNEKNVPLVDYVNEFDQWITNAETNKDFFEDLDRRWKQGPTSHTFSGNDMRQLRLFRDGVFFFYENSTVNYQ